MVNMLIHGQVCLDIRQGKGDMRGGIDSKISSVPTISSFDWLKYEMDKPK